MHLQNEQTRYRFAHLADIEPTRCPCGYAKRAFTDDPDQIASMHVVQIEEDSKTHYHKKTTEIYFILEGRGEIELDGERKPVSSGDAIMIKPGCRHRAIGKLKILNVPVPAFDPQDEWFD